MLDASLFNRTQDRLRVLTEVPEQLLPTGTPLGLSRPSVPAAVSGGGSQPPRRMPSGPTNYLQRRMHPLSAFTRFCEMDKVELRSYIARRGKQQFDIRAAIS